MAIIGLQRRLREAGRIRIGEQAVSSKTGKKFPKKLETFRFSSSDQRAIDMIAQAYGGTPEKWTDAPVGEQWQVTTNTSVLAVLVPPVDFAFSQFYETWSGGGCQKRCDGVREIISDSPCSCDPDERECKPHSRLGIILRDFSGVGLWRLDTSGYYAATELAGSVELLQLTQGSGSLTSARLMLEQRQVKRVGKDGKAETRNFAVPVLDLDIPLAALLGATRQGELEEQPSGLTPVPQVEAVPLAEQIEALAEPPARARRSNSKLEVKPTGIKPRPISAAKVDTETGEILKTQESESPKTVIVTDAQLNKLAVTFHELGIDERDQRIATLCRIVNRKISSSKELTVGEASFAIDELTKHLAEIRAAQES